MKHKHHIIPIHAGGSDTPDNIVELDIQEHANAHKLLYEEYGRWQDKLAWVGLAKLVSKEEHTKMFYREAGKQGAIIANSKPKKPYKKYVFKNGKPTSEEMSERSAKTYELTFPDGHKEIIKSFASYCKSNNLPYKKIHKSFQRDGSTNDGYTLRLVVGVK